MDPVLSARLAEARAAWPTVALDTEVFARHLAAREVEDAALAVTDLYLACACQHGDPAALALFAKHFLDNVPMFLSRVERSPQVVEDVRQEVSARVLTGSPPKIAEYSGRGPLLNWLRVVTVRLAVSARRKRSEVVGRADDVGGRELTAGRDPEIEYLKGRYKEVFASALKTTLAALDPAQRTVLRLHFVDGLSVPEIGALHGVHRGTAARWVAAAREAILDGTRARLVSELRLSASELDSLTGLVVSQLEVSLRGALAS